MDDYEIITRLGTGACGSVFLTRHKPTKKLLALKKIQLDEGRKTRTKEAVLREAKILSKLKHPNIVAYHDSFFDSDEEHLCIAQDYCDGGSLDDRIREAAKDKVYFPEKTVTQWFIQLAMAVQYIHSHRILHRDLKTQNVFLNKAGSTCKLGDFGISKAMDTTIELASTCVGTPYYLAPEMCQDLPYSSKADVWALGCLFYEMCALKPAFDANNLISLFYRIVKGEYDPLPEQYSSGLSESIAAILVKSPDERPSARQLLSLPYLQECLGDFIEDKQNELHVRQLKESPSKQSPTKPHRSSSATSSPTIARKPSSRQAVQLSQTLDSSVKLPLPLLHPVAHAERKDQAAAQESRSEHVCDSCGVSFRLKPWLQKHMNKKHGGESKEEEYDDDFEEDEEEESGAEESDEEEEDMVAEELEASHDDIPEDLPGDSVAEDDSDDSGEDEVDYADDFEEYDSEQELDAMVSRALELAAGQVAAGQPDDVRDDTIVDDTARRGCKNLIQEHCIAALGKKQFEAISKIKPLYSGEVTEEDLRPEFHHHAGSEHMETCFLVAELLNDST